MMIVAVIPVQSAISRLRMLNVEVAMQTVITAVEKIPVIHAALYITKQAMDHALSALQDVPGVRIMIHVTPVIIMDISKMSLDNAQSA
jgi:hypothetical protein